MAFEKIVWYIFMVALIAASLYMSGSLTHITVNMERTDDTDNGYTELVTAAIMGWIVTPAILVLLAYLVFNHNEDASMHVTGSRIAVAFMAAIVLSQAFVAFAGHRKAEGTEDWDNYNHKFSNQLHSVEIVGWATSGTVLLIMLMFMIFKKVRSHKGTDPSAMMGIPTQ